MHAPGATPSPTRTAYEMWYDDGSSDVCSSDLATGTGKLDRAGLAAAVQALGGDLSVSVDADRLVVVGNALASKLNDLLGLLAMLLVEPTYAKSEVSTERDRLIERLTIARARPGVIASETLGKRMWGDHPYALDLPKPEDVARVKPEIGRASCRERVSYHV